MKADVGRGSATGLRIRLGICNGGMNGLFKVFEHNHNRILKSLFCVSAKLNFPGFNATGLLVSERGMLPWLFTFIFCIGI